MAKAKKFIPNKLQPWIEARRKHHLSHAHVQMARELGMNPKKLGRIDSHRQEPWKQPLPQFIATLYAKRFGKDAPDVVRSIEDTAALQQAKKQARKAAKAAADVAPAMDAEAPQETSAPRAGCGAWKGQVTVPDALYESWAAEEMAKQES